MPEQWKESIIVPVYKKGDKKIVIIEAYHFSQLRTKFYPTSYCQGLLHMQRKLFGITSVDFDAAG